MNRTPLVPFVSLFLLIPVSLVAADVQQVAQDVRNRSEISGGFVVVIGSTTAELPLALQVEDRYLVHVLAPDRQSLTRIRDQIDQAGVYGRVSAELCKGPQLPYVDNLINLVVLEQQGLIAMDEVQRVLAPNGVACAYDGKLTVHRKPRPDSIDAWTHYLHDAGNNAVAEDTVVGPPRSLQWGAPPLWLRSHETPSGIQSPVSSGRHLFYFLDEGPIGITDPRLPDRWSLVCRDAFNGKLLWKRGLDAWGWREWNRDLYENHDWLKLRGRRTDVPPENQRRIVAQDGRVFVTLSHQSPLSILDAETGEILQTIAETNPVREILVSEGVVLTYSQGESPEAARRRGQTEPTTAHLVAVDIKTGKVMWDEPCSTIRPQLIAMNNGRVTYSTGKSLAAVALTTGKELWQVPLKTGTPKTLVAVDDVAVVYSGKSLAAFDIQSGKEKWSKKVPPISGAESVDLFVIEGVVWRGMQAVDENAKTAKKTPHVLGIGWDLQTGNEQKQVFVQNLRSPEHHHRCYRNKATTRYIISSLEGAEFLDLQGDTHSQENWIRGSCKSGMMPCNGMLYVPPDQCFCEPGAKLLGYAALAPRRKTAARNMADNQRTEHGPAFGKLNHSGKQSLTDWPTLRHDPARSGSTPATVPPKVAEQWRTKLTGRITAPVVANNRLYVGQIDSHRVIALDASTGKQLWKYTAGGRIDSPPTVFEDLVLFGSADGRVYCVRADDGELVWRFLAAPHDQKIGYFDQLESSWPVHGSVLVDQGTAYVTAGRSTYLDGGIHVYGLNPRTGAVRCSTVLKGPFPDGENQRDVSFYVLGANSDVLVSEGGFLYMRQKKLTHELEEVPVEVLSSKGAQDVGRHVFSTSGLLDGSWYNRTFWMYSKRWPGFQLANQAPKAGQLLVVDDQKTYALRVFYRRNVHSPMFFPEDQGYLVFADWNRTEPQIVGDKGSREPLKWLPQSDYSRARGDETRALESDAFGLDKMIGYTRAEPPVWTRWLPVRVRGMVKTQSFLFVAGAPDQLDQNDPFAGFEGRNGARLVSISADDGDVGHEMELDFPPVFDGLIAAGNRLYATLIDGSVVCLGE